MAGKEEFKCTKCCYMHMNNWFKHVRIVSKEGSSVVPKKFVGFDDSVCPTLSTANNLRVIG